MKVQNKKYQIKHFEPNFPFSLEGGNGEDYMMNNYVKPWCRFSPYICGIMVGYALHVTKNKKFRICSLVKD